MTGLVLGKYCLLHSEHLEDGPRHILDKHRPYTDTLGPLFHLVNLAPRMGHSYHQSLTHLLVD